LKQIADGLSIRVEGMKGPITEQELSKCRAYGKHEMYKQKIQTATLEKLAKLISICAMLLQTKVYLFWKSLNQPEPIWLKKVNNHDS
jgi:hypothetical protein